MVRVHRVTVRAFYLAKYEWSGTPSGFLLMGMTMKQWHRIDSTNVYIMGTNAWRRPTPSGPVWGHLKRSASSGERNWGRILPIWMTSFTENVMCHWLSRFPKQCWVKHQIASQQIKKDEGATDDDIMQTIADAWPHVWDGVSGYPYTRFFEGEILCHVAHIQDSYCWQRWYWGLHENLLWIWGPIKNTKLNIDCQGDKRPGSRLNWECGTMQGSTRPGEP